jgi:hypothetical protein
LEIEQEGDSALDIYIWKCTYHCIFAINEALLVGLTPKEHDFVMHSAK